MTKIPVLFKIMKEKGITQKQLAASIGASQGNVADWKSGRGSPSIDKLPLIADCLNVSIDYLLGRDEISKPAGELTEDERKLISGYRTLEQPQKELILHDIELLNRSNESYAKGEEVI